MTSAVTFTLATVAHPLDATCLPDHQLPASDARHGVDFLIDTIMAGAGDLIPVTIGDLTKMAMALVKEPRLRTKILQMVRMAAEFRQPMAEWNIRCDPEAAHLVFASGIPLLVTTWHIGMSAQFRTADVARISDC